MEKRSRGSTVMAGGRRGRALAGFLMWGDGSPPIWRRRFFVLYNSWLYRFNSTNIKEKPESAFMVTGCMVDTPTMDARVTEDQPKNLFRVTTKNKQVYLFNAESDGEMELWMRQLIAVSIAPPETSGNQRSASIGSRQELLVSPSSSPTSVSPRLLESPRARLQSSQGGGSVLSEDPPTLLLSSSDIEIPHPYGQPIPTLKDSGESSPQSSPGSLSSDSSLPSSPLAQRSSQAPSAEREGSSIIKSSGSPAPFKRAPTQGAVLAESKRDRRRWLISRSPEAAAIFLQSMFRARQARRLVTKLREQDEKRRKVAEEISLTEKNYVTLLLTVIEVIFRPLEKLNVRLDRAQSSQTQLRVPNDTLIIIEAGIETNGRFVQLEDLYSNTKQMHQMHSRFSEGLQEAMAPWKRNCKIGSLFRWLFLPAMFMNEYKQYVINYEKAVQAYQQSLSFHIYKSFFDAAIMNPRCSALDFCSLLISPVQRIPRYVLLLKELLRATWPEHCDYEPLKQALERIQLIAEEVNEAKRQAEAMQRTLTIQTKLDDRKISKSLTEASRRYIREGMLMQIVEGQPPHERYVFLFSDQMITSMKKTVRMGMNNSTVRFSSKGAILLNNVVVKKCTKIENAFKVRGAKVTKWQALTARERDSWMQDIQALLPKPL